MDNLGEEIIKLKEQGLSYERIHYYYLKKGINISRKKIEKFCKYFYAQKEIQEPKNKAVVIYEISEKMLEEIIELKEKQELSFKEISKYYDDKGIKVGYEAIRTRYNNYYKQRKLEKPKRKYRKKIKEITDEEIVRLRKDGLTYMEISRYYASKGIKVSHEAIRLRCKKSIEEQKSIEELNGKLNELLIKKEETQKLLQRFTNIVVKVRNELDQKEKGETR